MLGFQEEKKKKNKKLQKKIMEPKIEILARQTQDSILMH